MHRSRPAGAIITAVAAAAAGLIAAAPAGAGSPGNARPPGNAEAAGNTGLLGNAVVTLTSAGSGGAAASAPSALPAMAAGGRYVAFQSRASLRVSGSVPGKPATTWRVYLRDQAAKTIELLSDPAAGNATAPTVSADGGLTSYLLDRNGSGTDVMVAGTPRGGTGGLVARQVTGTARDLPFERIPGCPAAPGTRAAARTVPCGPRLSADGSTLVYPARISPVAPDLSISHLIECECQGGYQPVTGNVLDFGQTANGFGVISAQLRYTVTGPRPVTFGGVSATAPFSVLQGEPGCQGRVAPGASCFFSVSFDTDTVCPEQASGTVTGTVRTGAAAPGGQSALALIAYCNVQFDDFARTATTSLARSAAAPPACAAVPRGLRLVKAPASASDSGGEPLADFGATTIGRPFVAWIPFTAPFTAAVTFGAPSCDIRLVNPAGLGLANRPPAGLPPPCAQGEVLPAQTSCTAYVLVAPGTPGTELASLVAAEPGEFGSSEIQARLGVTGTEDVIIARHDPAGGGDFAASTSLIVSTDGSGRQLPDASQPSVSATGRYVAFTAPASPGAATSAWRHDTDARGNRSYRPGPTVRVSCLPGGRPGRCAAAPGADSPSLSGSGSLAAFATLAARGQVYVRNIGAGVSTLVSGRHAASSSPPNAASYAPALSADGSTVAYVSTATDLTATDLTAKATPRGAANVFVRVLAAPGSLLLSASGTSLPPGNDIALPAIDAHGGLITFQTSQRLLAAAPPGVPSIYTTRLLPVLTFRPDPVSFGRLPAGSPGVTRTITLTDSGPGPGTVTLAGSHSAFGISSGTCAHAMLHPGASCEITVILPPLPPGTARGAVTAVTTDDSGADRTFTVPETVTAVAPVLTLTPPVAPPGQVTTVTGRGFAPGQQVIVSWNRGTGQAAAIASSSGRFTVIVVIFPDDGTGPRILRARDAAGLQLAAAPFLVQQPSVQPPFTAPATP